MTLSFLFSFLFFLTHQRWLRPSPLSSRDQKSCSKFGSLLRLPMLSARRRRRKMTSAACVRWTGPSGRRCSKSSNVKYFLSSRAQRRMPISSGQQPPFTDCGSAMHLTSCPSCSRATLPADYQRIVALHLPPSSHPQDLRNDAQPLRITSHPRDRPRSCKLADRPPIFLFPKILHVPRTSTRAT